MASSPQLSGQSIVPRKRSQSGWRSCSGELAVFFFFSIFLNPFCDLFLPFFVLQPVYKHSGEAFYIVFSLQYMSGGFLPLGKFTPFLLVLFCAMCLSSLHIKRETEWGDKRKKGKANLVVILICSNSNNCIYRFQHPLDFFLTYVTISKHFFGQGT